MNKILIKQLCAIFGTVLFFLLFDMSIYFNFTRKCLSGLDAKASLDAVDVEKYIPFEENSELAKVDSSLSLQGELPTLDGAAALLPVYASFAQAVYPPESCSYENGSFTANSAVQFTNTHGAYKSVVDGGADIVFCAAPSKEQLEYAEQKGVDLKLVPIGREAFVFIVNEKNPVDSLTSKQIKDIYSRKITRWSEVGGNNRLIDPLTRHPLSGSQSVMDKFMGQQKIKKSPFCAFGSSIGFSFRCYFSELTDSSGVKMLSVDGVYPDMENISNGSYPLVYDFYAVYREDNNNENIQKLIEWILSDEGRQIIEKCGYCPLE